MKRILSTLFALALLVSFTASANRYADSVKGSLIMAIEKAKVSNSIEDIQSIATKLETDMEKISDAAGDATMSETDAAEIEYLAEKFEAISMLKIAKFSGALTEKEYAGIVKECIIEAITNMEYACSLEDVSEIANQLEIDMTELIDIIGDENISDASIREIDILTKKFVEVSEGKIDELSN